MPNHPRCALAPAPRARRSLSRRWLLALALPALSAPGHAQNPDVPVLVTTQWVASHANDRRLVIVAVGMSRTDYDTAHIAGAQFLPYAAYAQPRNGLTTEIPPLAALDSALESIGIANDSHIVIYGPPVISHRLFLALDVMGLRGQVGILDGGLDAWQREGRTVSLGAPPAVRIGTLELRPRSDVLVDRAWVREHLNDTGYQFVDARMRGFQQGHLQGAVNIPAFLLATPAAAHRSSWSLPPADSLQRMFSASGVGPSKSVVAYCAIGETASVVYFAARRIGVPARLYDGSLEDWGSSPPGPIVRSP